MQIFSMEIYGEISMEIDVLILQFSMEFRGIPWRFFTRVLTLTVELTHLEVKAPKLIL